LVTSDLPEVNSNKKNKTVTLQREVVVLALLTPSRKANRQYQSKTKQNKTQKIHFTISLWQYRNASGKNS